MRTLLLAGAMLGSLMILAQTPCLAQPADSQPPPPPPDRLQTPDEASHATLGNAASSPLHDMNVMRSKIPPLLLAAMADPYQRPNPATCQSISARVHDLNVVLGDDLDAPSNTGGGNRGASLGRSLVKVGAESLLPFSDFVRTLSGAEQHDRLVIQAITAGDVRRAYLKGLGEGRGCSPPGTPRHLVRPAEPIHVDEGPKKPKYPIR
jgi:hypothetical protein